MRIQNQTPMPLIEEDDEWYDFASEPSTGSPTPPATPTPRNSDPSSPSLVSGKIPAETQGTALPSHPPPSHPPASPVQTPLPPPYAASTAHVSSSSSSSSTSSYSSSSSINDLPPEIHIHISTLLPYPDVLALKHTSRRFYTLIPTTIPQRISWLVSRSRRGLECPAGSCDVRSDLAFCSSGGGVDLAREIEEKHGPVTPSGPGTVCPIPSCPFTDLFPHHHHHPHLRPSNPFKRLIPPFLSSGFKTILCKTRCTSPTVRDLIERRRRHGDCGKASTKSSPGPFRIASRIIGSGSRGCEVFIGERCGRGGWRFEKGTWHGVYLDSHDVRQRRKKASFWLVATLVLVLAIIII